ncbi:hypothetical protein BH11PLA2_BH11PLA2_04850 [soil metagenome]
MSQPSSPPPNPASSPPPRPLDVRAAILSYLLPGLGQVIQGRIAKGLVFFVGLYSLFFYGMAMGQMKNVWLPDARKLPEASVFGMPLGGVAKALYYRPQFLGQFWIGSAAWPALAQYFVGEPLPADGVIDDRKGIAVIGKYMMTPTETELNQLQRDGNKRWDLGWVYTLIAGVLNLLVIYDAFAGPAMKDDFEDEKTPTPPTEPKS